MTYTLKFEIRVDTSGSFTPTKCRWWINSSLTGHTDHDLGVFQADWPGGSSGVAHWEAKSVDITAWFDPGDSVLISAWESSMSTCHYRRVRVESDDGRIFYGEFEATGAHYTAADQDGYPVGDLERQIGQDEASDPPGPQQFPPAGGTIVHMSGALRWVFTVASSLCIVDSYDRANDASSLGVADTGQPWVLRNYAPYDADANPITPAMSILGINSNQVYTTDASPTFTNGEVGHVNIATIDHGFADLIQNIEIPTGFPTAHGGGLIFRWSPTGFWQAVLYRQIGSGAYYILLRRVVGTTLWTPVQTLISTAATIKITVQTYGKIIWIFANDVLVDTVVDNFNVGSTEHGVSTYFSTSVRLNNYSACPIKPWTMGAISI